jgi:acyl carrier protein
MAGAAPTRRTEEEIRQWLVSKLSGPLRIDRSDLDLDRPIVAHGVDSMQFVALVGELEDWLGCRFTDNPLIDYPSVNALSRFLAEQILLGKTQIDPLDGK